MATTVRLRLLGQDSRTDSMVSLFTLEHGNRIDKRLMQLMPLFSVASTFARTCSEGLVHLGTSTSAVSGWDDLLSLTYFSTIGMKRMSLKGSQKTTHRNLLVVV